MLKQPDMARQQALLDANPRQFLNIPAVQVGGQGRLQVLDVARHLVAGSDVRLLGRGLGRPPQEAVTLTTEQLQQGLLVTGDYADSLFTSLMAQQLALGCGFLCLGWRPHSDRAYLLQEVARQTPSTVALHWISPDARGYPSSFYQPLPGGTAEPGMLEQLQRMQVGHAVPPEITLLESIRAGSGLLVEVPVICKATTEKRFADLVVQDLGLTVRRLEESGFKAVKPFLVLVELPAGLGFEDTVPLLDRLRALGLAVVLAVHWPGNLQRDRSAIATDLAARMPHALHTQPPMNDAPSQASWHLASKDMGPGQAQLVSAGALRPLNLVSLHRR